MSSSTYKHKILKFIELLKKSNLDDKVKKQVFSLLTECKIETEQEVNNDVSKMTMAQLKEICKSKGLPVSGKKADLMRRIEGVPENTKIIDIFNNKEKAKIASAKKRISKAGGEIAVKKDGDFYVEEKSSFVFDENSKVVGKKENSKVYQLTKKDIEECKEMKFEYDLPENLDELYDEVEEEDVPKYQYKYTEEEMQLVNGLDEDDHDEQSDDNEE